jgi:hypothetical protein
MARAAPRRTVLCCYRLPTPTSPSFCATTSTTWTVGKCGPLPGMGDSGRTPTGVLAHRAQRTVPRGRTAT